MQNQEPVKKSRLKKIFNVRLWADADRLQGFFYYITYTIKKLFIFQRKKTTEPLPFDELQNKLGLTEEELYARQRALFRLSIFMFSLSILGLLYTLYQCFQEAWHATFLSFTVFLIALALTFRYHFWYFQIKQRKLGVTILEWFYVGLLRRKP